METNKVTVRRRYFSDGRPWETVLFGSYPQARVKDAYLVGRLNNMTGRLPQGEDLGRWTAFDFRHKGQPNFTCFYQDVMLDGQKYRGMYFTDYRSYYDEQIGTIRMEDSQLHTVCWFTFEPIEWFAVEHTPDDVITMVAIRVLDSQPFDNKPEGSTNNYAESHIRRWLRESFLPTAFAPWEQACILPVTLDNSSASTRVAKNPNTCPDTTDPVWLPSTYEIEERYSLNAGGRKGQSEYARFLGVDWSFSYTTSDWLLRSPSARDRQFCYHAGHMGYLSDCCYTWIATQGVAPAVRIRADYAMEEE